MGADTEFPLPPQPTLLKRITQAYSAFTASTSAPAQYPYTPGNGPATTPANGVDNLVHDIRKLSLKDMSDDTRTILRYMNTAVSGYDDDNKLLLEGLVKYLSELRPDSKLGKWMTDGFVNQLWDGLSHPPPTSLGDQYRYRKADGSGNSIWNHDIGKANTPYARSCKPMTYQNPDTLPDPGLVFDLLMARGDEPVADHPAGISSFLFYLATVIIHDVFRSDPDHTKFGNNLASSYLDLSPLYGCNDDEVKEMRQLKDGLLKPDAFSSTRILGFPPGCSVLLIMFNRFHNYVVTQLANINENNRFPRPAPGASEAAWAKFDEDLFQTGRLITGGLYVNLILKDYVRTILALNQSGSTWDLDPRTQEGKNIFSKPVPEGIGNQVSAEFNLVYRWHSAISNRDEKWTYNELKRLLRGKDPSTASPGEVMGAMGIFEASTAPDPGARVFDGLVRQADGTFDDDALVKILKESIDDVAGSFGANKVPNCMRAIEILGITQARRWNLATLNEFRQFVGLTRHTTFEDINPDKEVASKLQKLYDSPDSVELYPGLVAEKAKKKMIPGSGLCLNFTSARAILADAVALVRGDRFYTLDYTPKNLTNWGYNEANYDLEVDQGHVASRLFFRAFPNHFEPNSIYAHFPFVTPKENKSILTRLGTAGKYSWEPPKYKPDLVVIKSYRTIVKILNDQDNFKVTWGPAIERLTFNPDGNPGKNYCLAGDKKPNAESRAQVMKALYPPRNMGDWKKDIEQFFQRTIAELLEKNSFDIGSAGGKVGATREVDIVRDVISLAFTRFMAAMFSIPLKTAANPSGIYTEHQLFQVLMALFSSIFFDADVAQSFFLREKSRELAQQMCGLMLMHAEVVRKGGLVSGLVDNLKSGINMVLALKNGQAVGAAEEDAKLRVYGDHMIERMLQSGQSIEDVVYGTVGPTSTSGVANQTQLMSQCLDYYLGEGAEHLPELYKLAHMGTPEADALLMRYMLEGSRLRGTVAVYRDLATNQSITDYPVTPPKSPAHLSGASIVNGVANGKTNGHLTPPVSPRQPQAQTYDLLAGRRVVLDFAAAAYDEAAFPEPETVRLDRPLKSYIHYGWGAHQCAGMDISIVCLTSMFKAFVGLKGLQRAPGPRGQLKSMDVSVWRGQVGRGLGKEIGEVEDGWTGLKVYMKPDQSSYWPMPSTMRVRWQH